MNRPTPKKKRSHPRGFRKLVVAGAVWFWRGTSDGIALIAPDGKRSHMDASAVTGVSPDTLERGRWKGTGDGEIRPGDVVRAITRAAHPRVSA